MFCYIFTLCVHSVEVCRFLCSLVILSLIPLEHLPFFLSLAWFGNATFPSFYSLLTSLNMLSDSKVNKKKTILLQTLWLSSLLFVLTWPAYLISSIIPHRNDVEAVSKFAKMDLPFLNIIKIYSVTQNPTKCLRFQQNKTATCLLVLDYLKDTIRQS